MSALHQLTAFAMNPQLLRSTVQAFWERDALPPLTDYLRIPNKSPAFDPQWAANGYMEQATRLYADTAQRLLAGTIGASVEVFRLEGRTPVILIDVAATAPDADAGAPVLFYGHLDKQPEASGWSDGMGPWTPVLKDGKLYGRGAADDGYAMFGALGAILAMDAQGAPRGRCLVLIEACEESGSVDLPAYIDHLKERLATPSLVVCLDSGCGDYQQLWLTTSLRGMVGGSLRVDVLEEGVHSGLASGIVASSFRILRSLLSRLEDERTGEIRSPAFHAPIPPERVAQARLAAESLGDSVWSKFPFTPGMAPVERDGAELLLNQAWRPALAVTGLEGAPPLGGAGNVLRPFTAAKLSLRLPPTLDAEGAREALRALLERDPPYGAKVSCQLEKAGSGWNAPPLAPWLEAALERGSQIAFGKGVAMVGEGGSIPLMGMLADIFPAAQFVVTGVHGPRSNAHGPDEFLHLAMVEGLTVAMAEVLAAHGLRTTELKQAA